MNILYIGPYRQKGIIGITSLFVLINILSKANTNISSRPIYINGSEPIDIGDPTVLSSEKNRFDNYDMIIQHVDPKDCIKINSVQKNVIIPILNERVLDENSINKLTDFDLVLTDTKYSYSRIANATNKLSSKTKNYDYDIPMSSIPKNQFNIGTLDNTKKLYFIGSYKHNIANINYLCKSFIRNVMNNECSLILFLFDIDAKIKNDIESMIANIYAENNIKYAINRVLVAPIDPTLDNIVTAHQTGHIFIDLQDDSGNTVNNKFAAILNKPVVSFGSDDYEYNYDRNHTIYSTGCTGVSYKSIESKIKRAISDKTYSEHLIPVKKQHINKIL
jgi:hypothetical protein